MAHKLAQLEQLLEQYKAEQAEVEATITNWKKNGDWAGGFERIEKLKTALGIYTKIVDDLERILESK